MAIESFSLTDSQKSKITIESRGNLLGNDFIKEMKSFAQITSKNVASQQEQTPEDHDKRFLVVPPISYDGTPPFVPPKKEESENIKHSPEWSRPEPGLKPHKLPDSFDRTPPFVPPRKEESENIKHSPE